MPSDDKLFRFNPFQIEQWTPEQVKEQYDIFTQQLNDDDTSIAGLADNIEIYANMGYLIGEMIARYYQTVANYEAKIKSDIALDIYRERDVWLKEKADKPPAMTYFEAKVHAKFENELRTLANYEAALKRFKYAYESIEAKQNALKKKLESVRYDTLGR